MYLDISYLILILNIHHTFTEKASSDGLRCIIFGGFLKQS